MLKFFYLADKLTQYLSILIYISLLTEQTVSVIIQLARALVGQDTHILT